MFRYIQCVLGSRAYLLDRISNYIDPSIQSPGAYSYLRTNQLLNLAKKTLSEAMLKILLTAKYTNQLESRSLVFDNEETRYSHRFKSFASLISPPHPTYDMYLEIIDIEDFDVTRMVGIIKNDLVESKKTLENVLSMSAVETNTEMCHEHFVEVVNESNKHI
jgi:hypothetical protein